MSIESELEDLKAALRLAFKTPDTKQQVGDWVVERRKSEVRIAYLFGETGNRSYVLSISSIDSFAADGSIMSQDTDWQIYGMEKMLREAGVMVDAVEDSSR